MKIKPIVTKSIIQEPYFRATTKKGYFQIVCRMQFIMGDCLIEVPAGFYTNFASVPWFSRWMLPVNDKHILAAIAHDFLYSVGGRVCGEHFARIQCDKLFNDLMIELGVPEWKQVIMHKAVRVGGAKNFDRIIEENIGVIS